MMRSTTLTAFAAEGLPPVQDIGSVEEELDERRRHYRNSTRNLIDRFSSQVLVNLVDALVKKSTAERPRHAHALDSR